MRPATTRAWGSAVGDADVLAVGAVGSQAEADAAPAAPRAADRARRALHRAGAAGNQRLRPIEDGRTAAGAGRPGTPLLHRDRRRAARAATFQTRAAGVVGRPRIEAGGVVTRDGERPPRLA